MQKKLHLREFYTHNASTHAWDLGGDVSLHLQFFVTLKSNY